MEKEVKEQALLKPEKTAKKQTDTNPNIYVGQAYVFNPENPEVDFGILQSGSESVNRLVAKGWVVQEGSKKK